MRFLHIEGSRPEWCISAVYHAWDTPFWSGTLDIWRFFRPTNEIITFHLYGWCMRDVLLLPAFTLSRTWMSGSFKSVRWNAQTRPGFILSSERVLGNGVRAHANSKGKITFIGKILLSGGSDAWHIKQDSKLNTPPTSCHSPSRVNDTGYRTSDTCGTACARILHRHMDWGQSLAE